MQCDIDMGLRAHETHKNYYRLPLPSEKKKKFFDEYNLQSANSFRS